MTTTHPTVAPWIRGRVYPSRRTACGRLSYGMEIINTRTGAVIATDDCTNLTRIHDEAARATAIARGTWFWSYRRKDVK